MSLTIIKKTEISKLDTFNKWKQNPGKGEVFTPKELVNEILDQIPIEVWENPKSTFCDQSMGKGTFLIEIVNRLVYIYGYKEEDAKSRVFGCEIRVKYVNYLKRRGYKNVFFKDSLTEEFNMKFDVVLGNPPYQKENGSASAEAIWPKFVINSFELCKDNGYVCLIHPGGWRNVDGKFKQVQNLIKNYKLQYLEIHNEKDGLKTFGVETRYDWYVIKNEKNKNGFVSKIKGQDGKTFEVDITKYEFIPNANFEKIFSLVGNNKEDKVEIISDSSYHHQRNHISKTQNCEFIYPCIYTVKKGDEPTFRYSNINTNGHFGIPKLIWSNGRIISVGSIIDIDGSYGLTQYSYAIVDTVENLTKIKTCFDSVNFRSLMEDCAVADMSVNRKIIQQFRKDFWKDFLDENNNVIEPNHNND